MKKLPSKIILIFLFTIVIAFFWLRNPYFFPKPSESISLFIVNLFGATNQEEVANIEFYYVFFISSIIATILVLFPYKKILTNLSKGRS